MYNEYVMTSLRTKWGCSLFEIEKDYSRYYLNYFKVQIKSEINGYVIENQGVYTLSEKESLLQTELLQIYLLFNLLFKLN